ncbi:branched-chain amino acid ABC transporter permease, partial [Alphaproteobacteria bacterium]|nr:branched-chain amino acid ABC transporter permease [Alphaproteobacteria bacterium]
IFGPEVQIIDSEAPIFDFFDGFVTVPSVKILSLVLATALAIAVVLFMRKSRIGQAIRATSQDARAARVLGIDTDRIFAFTFSLNAAICGAAGVLVSVIWVIQPFYGIVYSVRSFAIVTAAGLGNLPAVIGTGFGLGLIEQYTGIILGAEYQVAAAVVMLLLVLIWRQIQMRRNRQVVR